MGLDVDLPDAPPLLEGDVLVAGSEDPGVGTEQVDLTEALQGGSDQRLDVSLAGDIAALGEAVDVGWQGAADCVEASLVEVGQDDAAGALPGEAFA